MEEESEHPEHSGNIEESFPPPDSVGESSPLPNSEEEVHTPIEESVLVDFKVGEHQKELKIRVSPKQEKRRCCKSN